MYVAKVVGSEGRVSGEAVLASFRSKEDTSDVFYI